MKDTRDEDVIEGRLIDSMTFLQDLEKLGETLVPYITDDLPAQVANELMKFREKIGDDARWKGLREWLRSTATGRRMICAGRVMRGTRVYEKEIARKHGQAYTDSMLPNVLNSVNDPTVELENLKTDTMRAVKAGSVSEEVSASLYERSLVLQNQVDTIQTDMTAMVRS